MEYDFKINLGNTSILRTMLYRNNREKYRDIFIMWLEEFDNTFTDLELVIEGTNLTVHCDWNNLIEDLMFSYDNNIPASEIEEDYKLYLLTHPEENITLGYYFDHILKKRDANPITINGVIYHNADAYNNIDFILVLIFHIWRSCNLSFPGVISFFNAEVIVADIDAKLSLDSNVLGEVYNSEYINCYQIKPISLKKTWNWYCKVIDMNSLVTKNNFDRTISSMFNYVRNNSFLQSDIVNLFLGVEAFYGLNSKAIKETLKKRGLEFLEIQNFKKTFSQGLSDFYDYRSRFIHGDLDIISYMDILQNFIKEVPEFYRYYSVCQFGIFFILASLQNAIEKDCINLSYIEITVIEKLN